MSVDAQKLQDIPVQLHMVWSAPLIIIVALVFLWERLGPAVLAGLGVMILLIPVNIAIATKIKKLQFEQMRYKDLRIRILNEVLNGMKVLKLYAWEKSFERKILGIREMELTVLRKAAYLNAATAITWFCAPFLVALSSFAVFVLSDENNILDANTAFVSLSLFNIMNYPMSILPAVIAFGVQAAVSLTRINAFLLKDEIDPGAVERDPSEVNPVVVDDATFSWDSDEEPTLKDIDFQVEAGSLVAVVGQVGSGKSSLMGALLGDMEKIKGRVNINYLLTGISCICCSASLDPKQYPRK